MANVDYVVKLLLIGQLIFQHIVSQSPFFFINSHILSAQYLLPLTHKFLITRYQNVFYSITHQHYFILSMFQMHTWQYKGAEYTTLYHDINSVKFTKNSTVGVRVIIPIYIELLSNVLRQNRLFFFKALPAAAYLATLNSPLSPLLAHWFYLSE